MTDGVDVSHVADWWDYHFILVLHKVVELFVGGVAAGYEVVLVEVGVVRTSWID